MIGRHGIRAEIVPGIGHSRVEGPIDIFGQRRVSERLAVNIEHFIDDSYLLPPNRDTAFDQIAVLIHRRAKNNDISRLRISNRGQTKEGNIGQRHIDGRAVDKFIGQKIVADQERIFHRSRRNIESLDDSSANQQG